jgi:7-cyano-7-deazaguanine reductase
MSDNQSKLNELVSVHLGKAGDGSVVKPYVTPDTIDASLIVSVPRELNRVQYGINHDTKMVGVDVWHAYEFSTMARKGYPVSGMFKWVYDASSRASENIIESKSAKLYLNSYNMHRWEDAYDPIQIKGLVAEQFYKDFTEKVGNDTVVDGQLHLPTDCEGVYPMFDVPFTPIEQIVPYMDVEFTVFNEDPNLLKVVDGGMMPLALTTNALRSNCRVTNQPDWGDVFVYVEGGKHVTPTSLLQYVVSMRKENHFHEEITECVYKRLLDLLQPDRMLVACIYTRRGGIDICPVRATDWDTLYRVSNSLVDPTRVTTRTQRQ